MTTVGYGGSPTTTVGRIITIGVLVVGIGTIPLGGRTLRVVGVRDDDADQPPVLVVEDMAG